MKQWDGMLWHAAASGDIDRGMEAIGRGANVNVLGGGRTPLHKASYGGHLDFCRLLIASGADPTVVDAEAQGEPLLHALANYATPLRLDIARFLLESGANPNQTRGENGLTPLHLLAGNGTFEISEAVRLLFEFGADPNAVGQNGLTPLRFVVTSSSPLHNARLLVAIGADPGSIPPDPDEDYLTPFQSVLSKGNRALVQYYIDECGQKLDQKTVNGRTMLDLVKDKPLALEVFLSLQTQYAVVDAMSGGGDISSSPVRRPKGLGML